MTGHKDIPHGQRRKSKQAMGGGLGRFLEAEVSRKEPFIEPRWNLGWEWAMQGSYQLELRRRRGTETRSPSAKLQDTRPGHQPP